jgi:iron complex outermembrane receptor protein
MSKQAGLPVRLPLLCVAVAAACAMHPALAADQTTAQAGADTGSLEEVVVTAEKRTENLQTVSITADSLSGAELQAKDVSDIDALQFATPSLSVTDDGITKNVNIRGIGLGVSTPAVASGVAQYRDGLFQYPIITSEPLYDMDHIEVLRGPQGTFVGSSSTGGAIFYVANSPKLNVTEGSATFQAGNYGDVNVQAVMNLPITDTLAARIAFNYETRDSFFLNVGSANNGTPTDVNFQHPGDLDERNVRIGLLWQPNDALTVNAKFTINANTTGGLAHIAASGGAGAGPTNEPYYTPGPLEYILDYHLQQTSFDEAEDRGAVETDYKFPTGITLRSITAWEEGHVWYRDDFNSSSYVSTGEGPPTADGVFENNVHEEIMQQEFNLLSPADSKWNWVLGAFTFFDPASVPVEITGPPGAPASVVAVNNWTITTKQALAEFGNIGIPITDTLKLEVGVRENNSRSHESGIQSGLTVAQWQKDNAVSGKAGLNWTITPNEYAYVFAAKGYKSGGITVGAPNFNPEEVWDYELGLKSTLLDGHLRTQLNGFYMNYSELQIASYVEGSVPGTGANGVINAGSSTIDGFEAQIQSKFGGLEFDGGLSYVHSVLGTTTYINSAQVPGGGNVPLGPQCAAGQTPVETANGISCTNYGQYEQTLSGVPNPYSPTLTATLGLEYGMRLDDKSTFTPRLDFSYTGKQYAALETQAVENQPCSYVNDQNCLTSRRLLNLKLTYQYDTWMVQGYMDNVTQDTYIIGTYGGFNPSWYLGAPRQYGVRFSHSFKL